MTDTQPRDRGHLPQDAPAGGPEPSPVYETGGVRLALLIASVVALGLVAGWPTVVVILGIVVMIFLHELGHFLTAKWSGMKVTEFFIGFGPRIWSFHRGETEYGFKAIPAGAYVRIIGMNNLDETDPADEPRTYRQQSFPKRLLVVSAGSIMHFLQAFVLLVLLLTVFGLPGGTLTDDAARDRTWVVGSVSPDSAAEAAGLEEGDRIVAFEGQQVATFDQVTAHIRDGDVGDEVTLDVVRDGRELELSAQLGARPEDTPGGRAGTPFLGVGPTSPVETVGLGRAVVQAPEEMVRFTGDALGALAGFFSPSGISDFADNVSQGDGSGDTGSSGSGTSSSSGDSSDENRLTSLFGVVRIGAAVSEDGFANLLVLFFAMNIFIGVFNMVPLPPLDGGHAAVAIYERARSRRGRRYHADATKLLPLTYAVVMVMVVLFVTTTYLDIVDPVNLGR
jgi:membrane-associated protease RseP (regulator of RpoE activity)